MIDVIFAYDVEDVYNPESDDALLQICRIHAEEGVPASMFVAAEKARTMRERGRRDVLDAIAEHEICYHGNYWGDFPEPATGYGVRLPFDEAVEMALHVEAKGLHDVAEITGQFPVAWCCHQAQQSLPMQYAMKLAGVRCWAGGPRGWIMNWLSWPRSNCVVSSQGSWNMEYDPLAPEETKPPADPDEDLRETQASFERMAQQRDFISFVGHPVCWVIREWGSLWEYATLFRYGSAGSYPRPRIDAAARERTPQDTEAAYEHLRRLLRWIRTRDDVNLTSYAALCERDEEPGQQWVTWEQLVSLARRMTESLDAVTDFGTSFSPADVTGMLIFAVQYCYRHNRWPEHIPVQRLLGPTEEPMQCEEPITLQRRSIFAGCMAAYAVMMDDRRLPGKLRASRADVGPAELLHLAAGLVLGYEDTGELPAEVTVEPVPTLPGVVATPTITDRRFGSSNMPPDLDVERLWDLLRWQSWSWRPAVPGRTD
ncbi:MAG: hypothetical protein U9R79_06655 [Armatimonadota bacterium]|nr:hypothetical protein [Armatimonadota bacterium]